MRPALAQALKQDRQPQVDRILEGTFFVSSEVRSRPPATVIPLPTRSR